MEPLKPRSRKRPEDAIVRAIRSYLHDRGWYTIKTHGNEFQSGLPDLYCCHPRYGSRWIEVKNPLKYEFTGAQLEVFRRLSSCNIGVWVLTAGTESEYKKLFGPANWHTFLGIMKP